MRIPILTMGDILLTSIQSDINDEHATTLQTDILERLRYGRARGVILDVTGLDIIDSYMARILSETVQMAQLMGGQVVISGMGPMVALTLVEMDGELLSGMTALNLEQAMEKLRARLRDTADEAQGTAADAEP